MALRFRFIGKSTVAFLILFTNYFSLEASAQNLLNPNHDTLSLKHELTRTYQMAYAFFKKTQNLNGSWSNAEPPALTGLSVYALSTSPEYINTLKKPDFIKKALDYLISNARENGRIYKAGRFNYNTSICVLALLATKNPRFHSYITAMGRFGLSAPGLSPQRKLKDLCRLHRLSYKIKARNYIATHQMDQGKKSGKEKIFDGGIGYGTQNNPDMHRTCIALEAIKSSQFLESGNRASAVYGWPKNKLAQRNGLEFYKQSEIGRILDQ